MTRTLRSITMLIMVLSLLCLFGAASLHATAVTKIVYLSGNTANQAAANKLADILALMNGTRLTVEADNGQPHPGVTYIHVGRVWDVPASMTTWLNAQSTQNPYSAVEEYVDSSGNVWLCGPSDRATWYAVGDGLYQLGFRWYVPSPEGMQYPTGISYQFSQFDRQYVCPFEFRNPPWQLNQLGVYDFTDWCALNGLNIPGDPARYGAATPFLIYGQNEGQWLTQANLNAHPDYFALVGGVRQATHFEYAHATDGPINTYVLPDALNLISTYGGRIYFFSPADWRFFSESPEAQALGSVSNNVFTFVQKLADKINLTYPNCKTMSMAYDVYADPPTNITLGSNVMMLLTLWGSLGYTNIYAPAMDYSANPNFYNYYFTWKNAAPGGLYTYPFWGDWLSFTPFPQSHIINYDLAAWNAQGLKGVQAESHPHWGTNASSLWAMTRNLWDPTVSESTIRSDFFTNYWGAAATPMLNLENYLLGQLGTGVIQGKMSQTVIDQGNAYMDQAATALSGAAAKYQWRYNLARAGWDNSVEWSEAQQIISDTKNVHQWAKTGGVYTYTPAQLKASLLSAKSQIESVRDFSGSDVGLWAFDQLIANLTVNNKLNGILLDPAALPVGSSVFNESYNIVEEAIGSARIFADSFSDTWIGSTWGLSLDSNQSAQLTYHFKPADPGAVIQNAQLQGLWMYNTGLTSNSVKVSKDNVNWTTLASNRTISSEYFTLDSYMGGASEYWVKFEAAHNSSPNTLVVDNCNFANTVVSPLAMPYGWSYDNICFDYYPGSYTNQRKYIAASSGPWTLSCWGWGLAANSTGTMDFHFKPSDKNAVFSQASVSNLYFYNGSLLHNYVKVSTNGTTWTTVGSDTHWYGGTIDITPYVGGAKEYWVRFEAQTGGSDVLLTLDNVQFNSYVDGSASPLCLPDGSSSTRIDYDYYEGHFTDPYQWAESYSGWVIGAYGLCLWPNTTGQINYHFKTANSAHTIQSASLNPLYFYNGGLLHNYIKVSFDKTTWQTIALDTNWYGANFNLTPYVAGHNEYWLKLEAVHDSSPLTLLVDSVTFNHTVQ